MSFSHGIPQVLRPFLVRVSQFFFCTPFSSYNETFDCKVTETALSCVYEEYGGFGINKAVLFLVLPFQI